MAKQSYENRELFINNLLKTHDCKAINTLFKKPASKLVTYQEKVTLEEEETKNGPPYDYTKYAQCDYMVTKSECANTIKNINNDLNLDLSDHFPIIAEITIDIKPRPKP